RDHVLLGEVVDDVPARVLDDGLGEGFVGDVLTDGPHELAPVPGEQQRLGRVHAAVAGEEDRLAVELVPGRALHVLTVAGTVEERHAARDRGDAVPYLLAEGAVLRAEGEGGDVAVDGEAV